MQSSKRYTLERSRATHCWSHHHYVALVVAISALFHTLAQIEDVISHLSSGLATPSVNVAGALVQCRRAEARCLVFQLSFRSEAISEM
mmetsp:Transcript_35993/g.95543  ORF Transcript_35993/g.95543 Transcript_35993/m.95543 type:complete len:88 (-) Transcript_35993:63-326(-)